MSIQLKTKIDKNAPLPTVRVKHRHKTVYKITKYKGVWCLATSAKQYKSESLKPLLELSSLLYATYIEMATGEAEKVSTESTLDSLD